MPAFEDIAKKRLSALDSKGRRRVLMASEPAGGLYIKRGKKKLLSFSSNDYLGLSSHPAVIKASLAATKVSGVGAGASRLVTGNHPAYEKLEKLLAAYKGTQAACVFGSGYVTNLAVIPALAGKGDLILADKLVHACIIDGIKLSGAAFERFRHNDMAHLEKLLQDRKQYENCFIITETIFSMDGDLAPLNHIAKLAKKYKAVTITDDAHGMGIVNFKTKADIQIGTLSKSAGSYGGYVCAGKSTIEYIKNAARPLLFSTALPAGVVAASLKSVEIMVKEKSRGKAALLNAQYFTRKLKMPLAESAIVPVIIGTEEAAMKASNALAEEGFLVSAIRPPTVPAGTSRLRFTFSAGHNKSQIDALIRAIHARGIA